MPPTETLIAFALAAAVFAYMPGPAMLYAAAQTVARGARAGWMAALGIHIGGYVHVIAASAGLAVLFQAVPTLYLALKLAGAAYLIWLGAQMILRPAPLAGVAAAASADHGPRRALRDSIVVEVLNPKTALFYLAFLPQFTDPAAALPVWAQLAILGTVVNGLFSSADVAVVLLAHRVSAGLRRSARAARLAQRIGGAILLALGTRLALSRA